LSMDTSVVFDVVCQTYIYYNNGGFLMLPCLSPL